MSNKQATFILTLTSLQEFSQDSLSSFIRMFSQNELKIFIIIVPEDILDRVSDKLANITKDSRYVVLSQSELTNGEYTPKEFYLKLSDYIATEYYIILKNSTLYREKFNLKKILNSQKKYNLICLNTKQMQNQNFYNGFYINLKRELQRDDYMRQELKELDFNNYIRFEAIDGKKLAKEVESNIDIGSLGCGFSHKNILKENLNSKKHLHILEDDAKMYKYLPDIFKLFAPKVEWDIIYTDLYLSMLSPVTFYNLNEKYKLYKNIGEISIVNLRGIDFSGATSYFVNKNSIQKLYDFLDTPWYKTQKHDTYINSLVQEGKLQAYTTMPFVSTLSQHSVNSTINSHYNSNMLALDTLRKAFYIKSDQKSIAKELKDKTKHMNFTAMSEIYAHTSKIVLHNLDANIDTRKL